MASIIETKGITKRFDGFAAVDRVDLRIDEGRALGIIGPNGAGKTTFFNLLTGLFPPTEGTLSLYGRDITGVPPHKRVAMGIVRTFQLVSVFDSLTVLENLVLASIRFSRDYAAKRKFFFKNTRSRDIVDAGMEALKVLGIEGRAGIVTSELSYGDKRKLEISIALSLKPRVLLLDEPFAGLSDGEISEVLSLINRIKDRFTFVIIEHKISRIVDLVDRMVVLHEGKLIAEGEPKEVLCDPMVREVYWGKEEGLICSV
jgi:branched-chain amino acid transport system ATP-binding protein